MLFPTIYLQKFNSYRKENFWYFKINQISFHSSNIILENQRLSNTIPDHISTLILVGAGNGSLLESLSYKTFIKKILLIEPIINFLPYQKEYVEKIKKYIDFYYIFSTEELIHFIQKEDYYILLHPSLKRLFPVEANMILSNLSKEIDKKTYFKNYNQIINNYYYHLSQKSLKFFLDVEPHPKKILFMGSGESLIQDIQSFLNQYSTKEFLIIASDTSLPVLKHFPEIRIDLIISIDPHYATLYHLLNVSPKIRKIPILSWLGARKEISFLFESTYFFLSTFPFDQILREEFLLFDMQTISRDVLGYVLYLSELWKASVLFLGCGIKNENLKQYYSKGTGYDLYLLYQMKRTKNLEQYHFELFKNQIYKIQKRILPEFEFKKSFNTINFSIKYKEINTTDIKNSLIKNFYFLENDYRELKRLIQLIK